MCPDQLDTPHILYFDTNSIVKLMAILCMVYQAGLGTCSSPAWRNSPAVKRAQITLAGAQPGLIYTICTYKPNSGDLASASFGND
jgi:hypothetical protein